MLKKLKIKSKIILIYSIVFTVILLSIGAYLVMRESNNINNDVDLRLNEQLSDLSLLIDREISKNQSNVISFGKISSKVFLSKGNVTINSFNKIKIKAIDQVSKSTQEIEIPVLQQNYSVINGTYNIVDEIGEITGGTNTIFQKINDGYLRISTNIINDKGERALNTYIPNSSPVAEALSKGETYTGRAIILGEWYLTYYEPIKENGKVIAAYYFGIQEKNLTNLKKVFNEKKYYTHGYPFVISKDGTFIIHPTSEGKSAAEEVFFTRMIATEKAEGMITYPWEGKKKKLFFKYYPKAEFYIAVSIFEEDIMAMVYQMIITFLFVVLIGIAICLLVGYFIGNNIGQIIQKVNQQIQQLIDSAIAGKLSVRANAEDTNIEFQGIVIGINQTLDAVIQPINVSAEYLDKISKGIMPELITDEYKGDFNLIKNNLNSLINSTNEIIEIAKTVAEGDLTVELKMRSEEDELIKALMDMVKSVEEMVIKVQVAADGIADASSEMSSNAQQVSQGATEQASSAEEVSSSMEEMSSNIQQNTDSAQQTEKISLTAADGMSKVRNVSQESLKSIKEIAGKISIIGDIAFQTNILALNAAVEAARAGEHGRGFAVVAAEVRKLAERSKIAADEINILSQSSVAATEESEKMIQKIIPDIEKTARLLQEIAAASMEQSSGASQINNAITQLNEVTQQNAAAAEEMATSSEELSAQSDNLRDLVGFFKVNNEINTKKNTDIRKEKSKIIKPIEKKPSNSSPRISENGKGVHIKLHTGKTNKDNDFDNF